MPSVQRRCLFDTLPRSGVKEEIVALSVTGVLEHANSAQCPTFLQVYMSFSTAGERGYISSRMPCFACSPVSLPYLVVDVLQSAEFARLDLLRLPREQASRPDFDCLIESHQLLTVPSSTFPAVQEERETHRELIKPFIDYMTIHRLGDLRCAPPLHLESISPALSDAAPSREVVADRLVRRLLVGLQQHETAFLLPQRPQWQLVGPPAGDLSSATTVRAFQGHLEYRERESASCAASPPGPSGWVADIAREMHAKQEADWSLHDSVIDVTRGAALSDDMGGDWREAMLSARLAGSLLGPRGLLTQQLRPVPASIVPSITAGLLPPEPISVGAFVFVAKTENGGAECSQSLRRQKCFRASLCTQLDAQRVPLPPVPLTLPPLLVLIPLLPSPSPLVSAQDLGLRALLHTADVILEQSHQARLSTRPGQQPLVIAGPESPSLAPTPPLAPAAVPIASKPLLSRAASATPPLVKTPPATAPVLESAAVEEQGLDAFRSRSNGATKEDESVPTDFVMEVCAGHGLAGWAPQAGAEPKPEEPVMPEQPEHAEQQTAPLGRAAPSGAPPIQRRPAATSALPPAPTRPVDATPPPPRPHAPSPPPQGHARQLIMPEFRIREEGLPSMEELFAQLSQRPPEWVHQARGSEMAAERGPERAQLAVKPVAMEQVREPKPTPTPMSVQNAKSAVPPSRDGVPSAAQQQQQPPQQKPQQQHQQQQQQQRFSLSGLRVLVSEELMENCSWLAAELHQSHGIVCLDAPLEEPVSMIIDTSTCVCILTIPTVLERPALKQFVKQLTSLCWKFSTIWLVITATDQQHYDRDGGEGYYTEMVALFQVRLSNLLPCRACLASPLHRLTPTIT